MKALVYLLPASLLMVACTATPLQSGSGTSGEKTQSPVEAVGQSALPPGVTFRPENSLIIGTGEQWVGRVVADVGRDVDAAFRFLSTPTPRKAGP